MASASPDALAAEIRSGRIRSAMIIRVDILPFVTSSAENLAFELKKIAPCCGRNSISFGGLPINRALPSADFRGATAQPFEAFRTLSRTSSARPAGFAALQFAMSFATLDWQVMKLK